MRSGQASRLAAQCRLRECRDGLLPVPVETKYWSFYEWNDPLSGEPIYRSELLAPRIDAPYQMFFLLFLDAAAELAEELGDAGTRHAAQRLRGGAPGVPCHVLGCRERQLPHVCA